MLNYSKKKERNIANLPLYLFPATYLPCEHFQFAFCSYRSIETAMFEGQ